MMSCRLSVILQIEEEGVRVQPLPVRMFTGRDFWSSL